MEDTTETQQSLTGSTEPTEVMDSTQIPSEVVNITPYVASEENSIYPSYRNPDTMKNGPDFLKELGAIVVEEFNIDEQSRDTWKENVAKDFKLFASYLDKKTFPWSGASNVCLPFLTVPVLQFQARAYDALIPVKEVVKILATGAEDSDRADRVGKYMNFQILYKMDEFEEGMDKSLLQLPIEGSVFRKTYYDSIKERNVSENIGAMDISVNFGTKELTTETRITHIIQMSRNSVMKRIKSEVFMDVGEKFIDSSKSFISNPMTDAVSDVQGVSEPALEEKNVRTILEQHRGIDLDGDGIEEPYVVTVDYETEKVLRITDRRYVDSLGREQIIEYFTHYVFIPNPSGFYGFGLGILLRHLNIAANTIVNEVIDAGSLANIQGGFVAKRSGIKKGSLRYSMGEFKEVDAYIDDIRKSIFNFDFKGPNQTLYAVLGLLYEYSKLVSSVSETMTGQLPASDTPAATVMALIEEGRKVFSSIHKRIHRSFKKEIKKLYRLNSIFLDTREYFKVLGDSNIPEGDVSYIGNNDFVDTLDIIPVSDPYITSKAEKIMKAQQVKQDVLSNPLTSNNPQAIYEATKKYYEAMDVTDIALILQPPPKPEEKSAIEENADIILEKTPVIFPNQDHLHHIEVHTGLLTGAFSSKLSPQSKQIIEFHNKEHLSALYMIENGGQNAEQRRTQ